jgi:hypothetical protein
MKKWALYTAVKGPVLIQKTEEIALKLNIEFTPLNRWVETCFQK